MATSLLERLLYMQGDKCFFCEQHLDRADASIEHIVAKANGGGNGEDNCVAVCKSLNSLFGSKGLKEKLRIILNRKGDFRCPMGARSAKPQKPVETRTGQPASDERLALIVDNLRRRGLSRPRKIKTLTSTVVAMFQKKLSATEVEVLLKALQKQGVVTVTGNNVSYELPSE